MGKVCDFCPEIELEELFNPYTTKEFVLGTIADIFSREPDCTLCELIARALRLESDPAKLTTESKVSLRFGPRFKTYLEHCRYSESEIDNIELSVYHYKLRFPGYDKKYASVTLHVSKYDQRNLFRFALLHDPTASRAEQQLRERRLDSKIDIPLIKSWLSTCLNNHAQACRDPPWLRVKVATNLRVIDVQNWSVIMAPEHAEYAALSYIWGGPQFVATLHDMQHLPWRLPMPPVLGKTIADALVLCAELEIKYLWVDALCMAQIPDQNADKDLHLRQMDRIYLSAIVTICAASSCSANSGIPELRQRKVQQQIFEFNGRLYACLGSGMEIEVNDQLWNWRGWTYQERILSRRSIIITQHQVYWICQCDTWTERTISEPTQSNVAGLVQTPSSEIRSPLEREFSLLSESSLPGAGTGDMFLSTYCDMVQTFTLRKLGTPLDGLNAITGVFNTFGESEWSRNVNFIWGLPTTNLDIALLWKLRSGTGRSTIMLEKRAIPSWTWASWFNEYWIGVYWDMSDFFLSSSILPAVNWHLLQFDGSSLSLPAQMSEYTKDGEVCGLEASMMLSTPPRVSAELIHADRFYLHFLTTTASFGLGLKLKWSETRDFSSSPDFPTHLKEHYTPDSPYELVDKHGLCVGHVSMPVTEAINMQGKTAEFVFLSYAFKFDHEVESETLKSVNQDMKQYPKSWHEWIIINCMMIEYDKNTGFAERRCLGKILKAAWMEVRPKSKWIVLG
jgi:hypothetical protein